MIAGLQRSGVWWQESDKDSPEALASCALLKRHVLAAPTWRAIARIRGPSRELWPHSHGRAPWVPPTGRAPKDGTAGPLAYL